MQRPFGYSIQLIVFSFAAILQSVSPANAACFYQEETSQQARDANSSAADSAIDLPEQKIIELIRELDANNFDQRERATRDLIALGGKTIPVIEQTLNECSAEAKLRGIFVLRTLALSDDDTLDALASASLDRLEKSDNRSTATKATAALKYISESREDITLARLKELGAEVELATVVRDANVVHIPYVIRFPEQWAGDNGDLRRLRWLVSIRAVEFEGMQFNDESIRQLKRLPEVHDVVLKKCSITDDGLDVLADIDGLARVGIYHCAVTDACVKHLRAIEYASLFKLYGTGMSREIAESLHDEQRGVEVDFRRGALLGVACLTGSGRCLVSTVEPDSAAEKAGIQVGDVIVQFDGKPVGNIEELTAVVAKFDAGSSAEVRWMRGSEELQETVKLGSW